MKQVCVPGCKDVMETCYKNVTKRICEPCTTYKDRDQTDQRVRR